MRGLTEEQVREMARLHGFPDWFRFAGTESGAEGGLIALAAESGVVVVEDDAYGDLRFSGEALPNLATLDDVIRRHGGDARGDRVIATIVPVV